MAQLELEIDRARDPAAWPDCCARCTAGGTSLVPMPRRHAKGVDGVAVPLCPAHADDWTAVRKRNRHGSILILLALAAVAATVWVLHPQYAGPQDQNTISRIVSSVILACLAAIALAAVMVWWAKTPIRILQHDQRRLTLAGVHRAFADRAQTTTAPPPLPAVDEAVRFDVHDYRPTPYCQPGVLPKALALSAGVGAVFGSAVGLVGWVLGEETANWPRNDWRYLGLAVAALVVYLVPLLVGRILILPVLVGGTIALAVVLLVLRLIGLPLHFGFAGVLSLGPLVLLVALVVSPIVWRWRIRSAPAAVLFGALGPLAYLAGVFVAGGLAPGPHQAAYPLGGLALLAIPLAARSQSRTPYCTGCEAWLVDRRIGSLPRSAAEVRTALADGQVIALAGLTPSAERAAIGDCELKVFTCDQCCERGTVVLELFDCRGGGKNGKTPTLASVGRWQYPGPALPVIEKLFPLEATAAPQPEAA